MAMSTKIILYSNPLRGMYRSIMTTPFNLAKSTDDLTKNPFYEKYAEKIKRRLTSNAYVFRLQRMVEKLRKKYDETLKPRKFQIDHNVNIGKAKKRGNQQNVLDTILNVGMLKGKSKEEVEEIWKQYYSKKDDVVFATMSKELFNKFMKKFKEFPTFVLPLPRGAGYEFFMAQHQENSIHFASVAQYKLHKENCPVCLCLIYFPDLPQDIVLMLGGYDHQALSGKEAKCLVNLIQFFYSSEDQFEMVKNFNKNPQDFDLNKIIATMTKLSLTV